jgi:hypothetical protein
MSAALARLTTAWRIWLAWCLTTSVVAFTVIHLVLWTLAEPVPGASDTRGRAGISIAFAAVGALVVTRRPRNTVGWLLCGIGFSFSLHGALDAYALHAVASGRAADLPGATTAAMIVECSRRVEMVLAFVFLPLLFPTGRLPSPRWRLVAWLGGLSLLLSMVTCAIRPGPVMASQVVVAANPLGIAAAADLLAGLGAIARWGLDLLAVLAVGSVALRFRHAQGVERLQLKWFAYAIVSIVVFDLLSTIVLLISHPSELLLDVIESTVALGLPVALGLAVLRYRLYEIDRLVNRTVVYGLLTVLLGLVYAAGVVVLGQFLTPTGGSSELPVAASTLVAAALFRPLRHRVQRSVDRRFNRRHYDAAGTIETFSRRLRHQIDLETISAELLDVVDRTMEPTSASLWLRPVSSTGARPRGTPLPWVVGAARRPP